MGKQLPSLECQFKSQMPSTHTGFLLMHPGKVTDDSTRERS